MATSTQHRCGSTQSETDRAELDKTQAITIAEALHVHPASILFADHEAVA
ncbi:MAG: hypothetical protein ACPGUV_11410 [Polyangiales bacterium]